MSITVAENEAPLAVAEMKLPLPHNCISPTEQSYGAWTVVAHPDTNPDQYHLNPKVFRDIAQQLNMFDKVQMLASDASWWADFLVVAIDRDSASLHLLQSVYLDTGDENHDVIPGFQIRRAQPGDNQVGWIIVNRETGKTVNLNTQIVSYDAAVHFLTHSGQAHPKHRSSGLVG